MPTTGYTTRKRREAMTASKPGASPADLVDFTWRQLPSPTWQTVHEDATEETNADGDVISSTIASDRRVMIGKEGAAYEPLRDEPALFKTFADLQSTEDAFAAFACQYGRLQRPHMFMSFLDQVIAQYGTDGIEGYAGSFDEWSASLGHVSRAVRLWEGLRAGRSKELLLAHYEMRKVGDSLLVYDKGSLALPPGVSPELELLGREPVLVAAAIATEREIAQALLRRQVARMLVAQDVSLSFAVTDRAYGAGLRLTFGVYTLEAAMWLQLALAIDGNREYQICDVCGKWWDATDARSHKKVCSDKCRAKKSYQARQIVKKQAERKG